MNPTENTPPPRAVLERFARARTEYTARDTMREGYREIPIVAAARRPLVPGMDRSSWLSSADKAVQALDAIRAALRAASASELDPRCVLVLFAQETGHGRHIWNGNVGNAKARPDANPELILRGAVWTSIAEPDGAYVLTDRGGSFDCYYQFPTLAQYCRYWKRAILDRNYPRTVRAWTQGGFECLAEGAAGLSAGGYSPEPAAQRARDHQAIWRRYERLCGARWAR